MDKLIPFPKLQFSIFLYVNAYLIRLGGELSEIICTYILDVKKNSNFWGVWVAQSVKHLTLGFGSGHDLRVVG